MHAFSLATLSPGGLAAQQIAETTVVALVLGCIVAVAQSHTLPHRILRWLHLTKRIGEVDIIYGYSDGGDDRELLLMDVGVYALDKPTGNLTEVDRVPTLYLGLDRKNVVLEFQRKTRP